jgi:hypothetical protein
MLNLKNNEGVIYLKLLIGSKRAICVSTAGFCSLRGKTTSYRCENLMMSEVPDSWDSEENFTTIFRLFLISFALLVSVNPGVYLYMKSRLNGLTCICQ